MHVVYGLVGLKTHCKLSMVVRQQDEGLVRYVHIGTGNYHPRTARMYEDYGLITRDPEVGSDVAKLFNQLSGYAPKAKFRRLLVAPTGLRSGLLERIDAEAKRARAGKPAWVKFKVNSVVDERIIDALYRASQAGVTVSWWCAEPVRCGRVCPGSPRTFACDPSSAASSSTRASTRFANDGSPEVFIGSADLMHRNLDRRIETLVSIADVSHAEYLVENIDLAMSADVAAWELGDDGEWERKAWAKDGSHLADLQTIYITRQPKRRAARK